MTSASARDLLFVLTRQRFAASHRARVDHLYQHSEVDWTSVAGMAASEVVAPIVGVNLASCDQPATAVPAAVTARLQPDPTKPTGPYNRVCDNSLGRRLLGWEPKVPFTEGLDRTIKWYYEAKEREVVARDFERMLTER